MDQTTVDRNGFFFSDSNEINKLIFFYCANEHKLQTSSKLADNLFFDGLGAVGFVKDANTSMHSCDFNCSRDISALNQNRNKPVISYKQ
jgi:uncharacterized membrane protein